MEKRKGGSHGRLSMFTGAWDFKLLQSKGGLVGFKLLTEERCERQKAFAELWSMLARKGE